MSKLLILFSLILFQVCLAVSSEENKPEHFTQVVETKDSSYGEILISDGNSLVPFGKIELFKNGELFYTLINTTVLKSESFRKTDHIAKVKWEVKSSQYTYIYVHRLSLDGTHSYTNNISGIYEFRYYRQSTGSLYGTYPKALHRENIELGLNGYKKNRIELVNQKDPVQFDCKFDLRSTSLSSSYKYEYTSIRIYLNNSVLMEYNVSLPNSTNGYLQSASYSLPGWLVNGRAVGKVADNSFSVILSDVDQDLSGKYYCEIDYQVRGLTAAYIIKSNLVYLKIK